MLSRSDRPVQAKLQCGQLPDPQGAVRKQNRYYALKLPIAVDAKTAIFVYVDPGNTTDTELRSWGAAHEWLWRALRGCGRRPSQGRRQGTVFKYTIKGVIGGQTTARRWTSRGGVFVAEEGLIEGVDAGV